MSEIVEIIDFSYEGAGVGKVGGQVIFVPKTLPGEVVKVDIVKRTNSFLVGKVVKILQPSAVRIEAKCPYFDICGGCDFQHCEYEKEQSLKVKILQKELSKVGFAGEIGFVSSSQRFAYRNKIKLEVVDGKLGYFKAKTRQFFEVKTCPIASEDIQKTLPFVRKFLEENALKNLKNVYIKQVDEQIAICFLFDKNAKNVQKNIKNLQILSDFSVFFAFGEILESNQTIIFHMSGNKKLIKEYSNFSTEISVNAFNQVNDEMAEKLYNFVLKQTAGKRIVNAFSGQGLLTRRMSESAKFVYGIEMQKSAHEAAQKLTEELPNVENVCGKVEKKLSEILLRDYIDLVVLDPAREGCKNEALQAILSDKIASVIYVSCNFATLVRDLRVLLQKYTLEKVQVFDMFPCTAKMETVAILRAK